MRLLKLNLLLVSSMLNLQSGKCRVLCLTRACQAALLPF